MKEKVIHTRVTEELYDNIAKKAKKHRMTVSNLLRNVVEDGLDIYDDVSDIVDEKIREKLQNKDEVIGKQKITIVKDQKCSNCKKTIKKNTEAFLEIYEDIAKKTIRCLKCD